jgi:hypothetical protein
MSSNINHGANYGIQVSGQARDINQTNTYGQQPSQALPPDQAALAKAVEALRAELTAFRAHSPHAIAQAEAEYLDTTLAELGAGAAAPKPERHVLRRGIDALTSALAPVAQLATGVAALRTAYEGIFPPG